MECPECLAECKLPLEGVRQQTLSLSAMPRGAYSEVIKGPARRLDGTARALEIPLRQIAQNAGKDDLGLVGGEGGADDDGDGEVDERPFHPLISHATVPPLPHYELDVDVDMMDDTGVRDWLAGFSA